MSVQTTSVPLSGYAKRDKFACIVFRMLALAHIGLASWHIILPWQFNWSAHMTAAPTMLAWTLEALNLDFSLLIFIFGIWLWHLSGRLVDAEAQSRLLLTSLIGYWIVHGSYLIVHPFPLPESLKVWQLVAQLVPWVFIVQLMLAGWLSGLLPGQRSLRQ